MIAALKPLNLVIKLSTSDEFAGAYVLACGYSDYEIELKYDKDALVDLKDRIEGLADQYPQHPVSGYTLDAWNEWLDVFSDQLGIKSEVGYEEEKLDRLYAGAKRIYAFRDSVHPKDFANSILSEPSWFLEEYGSASKVGTFYECLNQYRKYDPAAVAMPRDFKLQEALSYGIYTPGSDEYIKIVFHPEFVQKYTEREHE